MKATYIVPTLGERPVQIKRLLDSILKQKGDKEVIIISQDNHDNVDLYISDYIKDLSIVHLKTNKKGLSHARNLGIKESSGDLIILSDDDCWYNDESLTDIVNIMNTYDSDVVLTKIYDPINKTPYKKYKTEGFTIQKKIQLLSKSSIEIAFKKNIIQFDENFGLGGIYVAGEEADFLIQCLKSNKKIRYEPKNTVFHLKSFNNKLNSSLRIEAKGALYSKNFNFMTTIVVNLRDIFLKKQLKTISFYKGYINYKNKI